MSAGDRPQDVGRRHKRARALAPPEELEVLARYREAVRLELGELLEELRPDRAQLTLGGGDVRLKPPIAERSKLWELAIRLGRELDRADPDAPAPAGEEPAAASSARAPRLTARERRALGAED